MNCPDIELLLFAERDGALDDPGRAALATHLAQCSGCREKQFRLAAAATAWRATVGSIPTPAVEPEWHAIRRRIRNAGEAPAVVTSAGGWWRPWGVALGTAALVAVGAFLGLRETAPKSTTPGREWTYVSYVTVEAATDSTMVYEDPNSGWLVVWVGDPTATSGS